MVLKCAMDLDIPDIIHSYDSLVNLSSIATRVDGMDKPSPRSLYLVALLQLHELVLSQWLCLVQYVKEGGVSCFHTAYGQDFYDKASVNGEFNKIFNASMSSWTGMIVEAMIEGYKEGLGRLNSLVDVSGRTFISIAKIKNAYPNIKGVNLDLPHVIALAEEHEGVTNVGRDMFESTPRVDAVFIKNILHNWKDEECINILGNCRRAIPKKFGKVIIIIDVILGDEEYKVGFRLDTTMMVHFGGKERSEAEWKKILEAGGFPLYNVTPDFPLSPIQSSRRTPCRGTCPRHRRRHR